MSDDELSCQRLRSPGVEDAAPQIKRRRGNPPERRAPTLMCRAGSFRQHVLAASVNDATIRRPRSTCRKSIAHTPLPNLAARVAPEPVRSRVDSPLIAGRARSVSPEPQTPQTPFRLRPCEGTLPTSVNEGSQHSSRQSLSSAPSRTPSVANSQSTSVSCSSGRSQSTTGSSFSTSSTLSLKQLLGKKEDGNWENEPIARFFLDFDNIRREIRDEEARMRQGIQLKRLTIHREMIRKQKKERQLELQVKAFEEWQSSDLEESRRSRYTAEVAAAAALTVLNLGTCEVAYKCAVETPSYFAQRLRLAHKSALRSGNFGEVQQLLLLRQLSGHSHNDQG